MADPEPIDALVIGAGPAGLMAAEVLSAKGLSVLIADAMPSPARKFLMAGKSGLNLTKEEPFDRFLAQYGKAATHLRPMISAFGPDQVRAWAAGLDQELFVGSTGLVFPRKMKASPLLRAWLARLGDQGVELRRRWRWTGWDGTAARFSTPEGEQSVQAGVTILATGGNSWRRLGSDGSWAGILESEGIASEPFVPSNAGISVDWTPFMDRHFGQAIKGAALKAGGAISRGEFIISQRGLEGGGVYKLTPAVRRGQALILDLKPDVALTDLEARFGSFPEKIKARDALHRVGLSPAAIALVQEWARPLPKPRELGATIKALKVPHSGLRPIDEAISTGGGLAWGELDDGLMIRSRPGVFAAGEMLDWEAPTGGYLLTACFATGHWVGNSAARLLA